MAGHSDSPSFTRDELETWSSLATLMEWLPGALDAQLLGDSAMTHFEYGMLYALTEAPNRTLRMSELAGYANSSLSRLSRAVSRLERRGWMQRTPDPTDGRFTLAILTESGLAEAEKATPGHVRTVRRLVLDRLTPAQTKQLTEISRRILAAIRADEGWQPTGAAR